MENLPAQQNPLKAFFRKPGIWIKLPSQGKFYQHPPADLNEMGEIPVYPLTAKDELMLKNADALLNGHAITQVVKSCAPSIVDPENMPAVDLDAILVAIKRCTYGEKMSLVTKCDCENAQEQEIAIDLNSVIANIKVLDESHPIDQGDGIQVFIRPVSIKNVLALNWVQYEQVRALQVAEAQNVDEKVKIDILQKSYTKLTDESLRVVAECIDTVLLPDGTAVNDKKLITEWVTQLSKPDYSKLEKAIMDTNTRGVNKDVVVHCPQCNRDYTSTLDLNPTTFFA